MMPGSMMQDTRILWFQLGFQLQCTHGTDIHTRLTAIARPLIYPYPRSHQLDRIRGAYGNASTTVSAFVSIYVYHRVVSFSLNICPSNVLTSVSSSSHASCGKPAFQHVWHRNSSADQLFSVATCGSKSP